MKLQKFLPIAFCTLALAGCGSKELSLSSYDGSQKVTVLVEIADTPKERDRGLMDRDALEEGKGMLFVFKEPEMLSFWMKNTRIPLEILYFDQQGEFVNVASMVPCTADPCPRYEAAALSQYALEVNPGFRETHKIGVGWKLDMKRVQKISRPK